MKPLKKAEQKSVIVNRDYYLDKDIEQLLKIEGIFNSPFDKDNRVILVSLAHVLKLDVVLNQYGYYSNQVKMITGETVFVKL